MQVTLEGASVKERRREKGEGKERERKKLISVHGYSYTATHLALHLPPTQAGHRPNTGRPAHPSPITHQYRRPRRNARGV